MTQYIRDDHPSARDEDGVGMLFAAGVGSFVGGVVLCLVAALLWWLPWEVLLRIGAGGLLLVGSALIFGAIARLDRLPRD